MPGKFEAMHAINRPIRNCWPKIQYTSTMLPTERWRCRTLYTPWTW